jgi:hypothetical protein
LAIAALIQEFIYKAFSKKTKPKNKLPQNYKRPYKPATEFSTKKPKAANSVFGFPAGRPANPDLLPEKMAGRKAAR